MTDEQLGQMKLIFNYNDVFYSFFYDDLSGCVHRSREYAINYVYSGEMILDNGNEQIHVGKGECVFIPRDHHITMYKKTKDGERYCGIFLMFTRRFLREMYGKLEQRKVPTNTAKLNSGVIKLPKTAELASLFASMTPYFDPKVKPADDLMQLKLQEGLLALLHIDKKFAPLSRASAFASIVLPVPGGPNSSRPLQDFSSDDCAKISGRRSGRMIVS
mgnify:CR=1 FL=1